MSIGTGPAVPINPALAPQAWRDVTAMTPAQRQAHDAEGWNAFVANEPKMSWLGENLPWLIGTGGLAASFAAPAAFGMGAATSASGAGAAAAGGALAPTTASGAYAAGMFGAPSMTAGANMAGLLGSGGSMASSGFGSGVLGKLYGTPGGVAAINAGTSLIGTGINAHANSKAAQLQAQAAQASLDFLKQQYATAQQQYKPFLDASTAAVGRMGTMAANAPDPMAMLGRPGQTPNFGSPAAAQPPGASLVTLRSPDGKETQHFQAGDPKIQAFLARGAVRVA